MKLIIEIDDKDYELAKADKVSCGYQCRHIMVAVKNGTPYNPSGDAISREALKDEVIKHAEYYADRTKEDRYNVGYTECACEILDFIDNAQAVEPKRPQCNQITWEQGYEAGLAQGKHRPQGEWIEFADYVARNVVSEDFSEDVDFYAEVLCRKLVKLGLVKLDGDIYKYCGADMRKGGAEE